jgi:hypothetical protein
VIKQAVKILHVPRVWRRAKPARRREAPLIRPQGECQTRVSHRDCEKSAEFGNGSVENQQQ